LVEIMGGRAEEESDAPELGIMETYSGTEIAEVSEDLR
jgi:hypothetical protein